VFSSLLFLACLSTATERKTPIESLCAKVLFSTSSFFSQLKFLPLFLSRWVIDTAAVFFIRGVFFFVPCCFFSAYVVRAGVVLFTRRFILLCLLFSSQSASFFSSSPPRFPFSFWAFAAACSCFLSTLSPLFFSS